MPSFLEDSIRSKVAVIICQCHRSFICHMSTVHHQKCINYVQKTNKEKLSTKAKEKCITKLKLVNDINPCKLGDSEWSKDLDRLPPITVTDVGAYLVFFP